MNPLPQHCWLSGWRDYENTMFALSGIVAIAGAGVAFVICLLCIVVKSLYSVEHESRGA